MQLFNNCTEQNLSLIFTKNGQKRGVCFSLFVSQKITFIYFIFDVLFVCYISLWPFLYVHAYIYTLWWQLNVSACCFHDAVEEWIPFDIRRNLSGTRKKWLKLTNCNFKVILTTSYFSTSSSYHSLSFIWELNFWVLKQFSFYNIM